ncbi:hypothetical protein E2C01_078233 [Portunus trituberculatus]|uniref:Uncharacterized protein n=1 Tax=Portunus trituberculatus TaxID=210409 RepID=A0A5B7IDG1_PORTR|nr:hypothetical protein [Portunus trituberculatus]
MTTPGLIRIHRSSWPLLDTYEPWVCGFRRRGSWPVFLKKAQVRRRTAGSQEGWTPEAARRVGRSSVVMARRRAGSVVQYICCVEAWALKQEMFRGLMGSPAPRTEGVTRQM